MTHVNNMVIMKINLDFLVKILLIYQFSVTNGENDNVVNVFHHKNANTSHVIEDGPYGGDGGDVHLNGWPSKVTISVGHHDSDRVLGIQIKYGDTTAEWHGKHGSADYDCDIDTDERISIVQGRAYSEIDQLEFITNKGKVCGPYGGNGGNAWVSTHAGCFLSYISGRSYNRLDAITLHWECED